VRYLLQLGWLQDKTNCLAVFIVTGKRVCTPRLVEDQGQMSAGERDLYAACKARLIPKLELWVLVIHAGGVPPSW